MIVCEFFRFVDSFPAADWINPDVIPYLFNCCRHQRMSGEHADIEACLRDEGYESPLLSRRAVRGCRGVVSTEALKLPAAPLNSRSAIRRASRRSAWSALWQGLQCDELPSPTPHMLAATGLRAAIFAGLDAPTTPFEEYVSPPSTPFDEYVEPDKFGEIDSGQREQEAANWRPLYPITESFSTSDQDSKSKPSFWLRACTATCSVASDGGDAGALEADADGSCDAGDPDSPLSSDLDGESSMLEQYEILGPMLDIGIGDLDTHDKRFFPGFGPWSDVELETVQRRPLLASA